METITQEATQTVSLAMLQRLAACKSNLVGIPRPGRYAFTLRRDILAKLIEGLDDDNADATLTPDWLVIESVTRHYSLKDAFEGHDPYSYQNARDKRSIRTKAISVWGHSKKAKSARQIHKKVPAYVLRHMKQLQKRLGQTWYYHQKPSREFWDWLRAKENREAKERQYDGYFSPKSTRERILAWYQSKPQRKALAKLQAAYINNKITLTRFYKQVRELGIQIEPLSKQCKAIKDRGEADYVKHFYSHKPQAIDCWDEGWNGPTECRNYNDSLRERREMREDLAMLEASIQRFENGEPVEFPAFEE